MQVARDNVGGEALMALTVDSGINANILADLTKETGAKLVHTVNLVG
jgi:D-3-phosphoglycerate dehydrogenase